MHVPEVSNLEVLCARGPSAPDTVADPPSGGCHQDLHQGRRAVAPRAAGSCHCRAAFACRSVRCHCTVRTSLSDDDAVRGLHVQPATRTAASIAKSRVRWHPVPGRAHMQVAADPRQCACGHTHGHMLLQAVRMVQPVLTAAVLSEISAIKRMLPC